MKSGIIRRILSGMVATALVATLAIPAMAATNSSQTSVLALDDNSLLVTGDGKLWRWGDTPLTENDKYLLTPTVAMSGAKELISISGGRYSSLIKQDGSIWGTYGADAQFVQLTNAQGALYSIKNPTVKLADNIVKAYVSYDKSTIYALSGDHTAYFFDDTTQQATRTISNVKELHPGPTFHYIVKTDNSLWGWGDVRTESWVYDANYPEMQNYTITEPIKLMDNVSSIDRSDGRTVGILKTDGTLYGVGYGEHIGVPNQGKTFSFLNPLKIDSNVVSVQTGCMSSVIYQKSDSSLWGIGENGEGYFNTGTSTYLDDYGTYHYEYHKKPQLITGDVDSYSISDSHIMILKKDGTLWTCGDNYRGALGDGSRTDKWKIVQVMSNLSSLNMSGFTDVPDGAWYAQDVAAVQELGIIQGKGNGQFDPNGTLTIAQAITMAAKTRAHYNNETIPAVEGGSWYSGAVAYATEQGIISEAEFTDYGKNASRGEMAFLFANALPTTEYKAINSITELPDVSGATKYSTEIFRLYNAGILSGSDVYGTYHPNDQITRAQATAILNRVVHPENRKVLTLENAPVFDGNDGERTPRPTPLTLRWDDLTRPYAREGDIFIAQNGTEYKLTRDTKTDIVGYGQPIATELGRTENGQTVTDGCIVFDLSRPANTGNQYLVNDYTGEGHWLSEWNRISDKYYPDYNATQNGELSKDKNFVWSSLMGGWNLVVAEKM